MPDEGNGCNALMELLHESDELVCVGRTTMWCRKKN